MATLKPPVSDQDHIRGTLSSPVILLEFGDFECPHCAAAHSILKKLEMNLQNRMAFVFRHLPLAQVHEYARTAAISSEAAGRQGKFWEMHDLIFENQSKLSTVYLLRMAESLGLDMKTFQKDTYDVKLAEKVDADFESGVLSGVNGTPSFFINGIKYDGAYDLESMTAAVLQTQLV
jgi:protein-disulfide isomerase